MLGRSAPPSFPSRPVSSSADRSARPHQGPGCLGRPGAGGPCLVGGGDHTLLGVKHHTVWRWRKVLGVGQYDEGTRPYRSSVPLAGDGFLPEQARDRLKLDAHRRRSPRAPRRAGKVPTARPSASQSTAANRSSDGHRQGDSVPTWSKTYNCSAGISTAAS